MQMVVRVGLERLFIFYPPTHTYTNDLTPIPLPSLHRRFINNSKLCLRLIQGAL